MNAQEVMLIFCLASGVIIIGVSILFFRVVYKKRLRKKANRYTWLWSMPIILFVNALLNGILLHDVDTGGSIGGAIGFPLFMIFYLTPFFGLIIPSIWAIIRAIYIKATPSKERDFAQKTPEPTLQ